MERENHHGGLLSNVVSLIIVLALSTTLVAAGLAVCCLPQTTSVLAGMFSGTDNTDTPFSQQELVRAAVATRDYTVGSHDQAAVMGVIAAINKDANTAFADADQTKLLTAPEVFTLNAEALSHLDDVYRVISVAYLGLGITALAVLAGLLFLGVRLGKRRVGGLLLCSGALVVAVFATLAAWVIIDFNGFFAAFHSVFFAAGTWTFSYESLLITMYPPAFWIGMGAVWLAVTGLLSILAMTTGVVLRRNRA